MKKVWISGISAGIGFELAKLHLEMGHEVYGIDIKPCSLDIHWQEMDLRKISQHQDYFSSLPHMDYWYNNAGITQVGAFQDLDPIQIQSILQVNTTSLLLATQLAMHNMSKPQYGKIINIASMNGLVPTPYNSVYAASKFAVVGFTLSLQEEFKLQDSALSLHLVLPGFTKTAIMQSSEQIQFPKNLEWMIAEPASVAKEILEQVQKGEEMILCGKNAKYIHLLHRLSPGLVKKSSRILLAKNWKELLGLEPIQR